jgi:hypothetical protein
MLNDKEKDLKETVKEIDQVLKMKKEMIPSEEEAPMISNPKSATQNEQKPSISSADPDTTEDAETSNNNEQILALYSEGKSIVEISKLLDLGQGEVKLVIDLFCGKK